MDPTLRLLADIRAILDAAPDAMVGVGADGEIVLANRHALALFGWEEGDLIGQPVEVLVPDAARPGHPRLRDGFVREPHSRPMGAGLELFGRRRDGSSFPAEISLGPINLADRVLILAAVRDVTEQRRVLARSRALLEGASDAVIGIDQDGRVVLVNQRAEERFGTSRAAITGAAIAQLLAGAPDDAGTTVLPLTDGRALAAAIEAVLAGRANDVSLRVWGATDGAPFVLEAQGRAVMAAGGMMDGMLVIFRDVTGQVALEDALRDAKDEAERANFTKSEFLSRMSHELRTPLNAILGFGQLLELEEHLAEDDRRSVDQILSGGRHLLGLIDEVLDISRIETGDLGLSIEPVRLDDLVAELQVFLAPLADRNVITLVPMTQGPSHRVMADLQRLKQVLVNLLSNAIKYNDPGGSVEIRAHSRDGGVVRIEVADTGWGIDDGDLERAFTAFDRLGADRTEVEGIGLGLALTRGLVQAMGGSIGARANEGVGTTFWVDLPGQPGAAADVTAHASSVGPHHPVVLQVEDNPANAMLVERILGRMASIRVITASSGEEALALASDLQPGLVLLDMHLPDLGGREVLRRLRASAATASIPVVMISADAEVPTIEELILLGAAGYVAKPLDVAHLVAVVRSVLDLSR